MPTSATRRTGLVPCRAHGRTRLLSPALACPAERRGPHALPTAARVVVVVVVPAGEDHAEHDGLHDRGDQAQYQTDLHADVVAEVRADRALAEVYTDGKQQRGGREPGRDRAGHTPTSAALGGAEQRNETGREREPDDRGGRHLEREAGV